MSEIISTLKYFPNNGISRDYESYNQKCEVTCRFYNSCAKYKKREKTISLYLMDSKNIRDDKRNCYIASAIILSEVIKKKKKYDELLNEINSLNITKYTTVPSSEGKPHEFILEIMNLLFPNLTYIELIKRTEGQELKNKTASQRKKYIENLIESEEITFTPINENILLVDDIVTTGTSLDLLGSEMARKNNKEVIKYAIAKTTNE